MKRETLRMDRRMHTVCAAALQLRVTCAHLTNGQGR